MEIEFKFHIPSDRLKSVEADVCSAPSRRKRLRARYFDTADGVLARHGAVLRLRKEGTRWVQTAKALGDGPLHRLEHNVDLGAARASGPAPQPDVWRHAGTPVGERLAKLLDDAGMPLIETYGTDIWRVARNVEAPRADVSGPADDPAATVVELALDIGRVVAQPPGGGTVRVSPVCELELELVSGEVAGLVELARQWSRRHGLWFSTVSKAERGERLLADITEVPAVKATPPRFEAFGPRDEDADGGHGRKRHTGRLAGPQVQRAVVAACLAQILPNASEVAADNDAAEIVHQLRVGIRRLRTALRELDALGPGFDPAWEAALVDAFRGLGVQRDRQLLAKTLVPRLDKAGAPPVDLQPAVAHTASSPGELVRAPDFQAALVGLIGFAATEVPDMPDAASDARSHLRERLRKLHARTVQDAQRFETLDAEARHKVRKRLKRLRYLSEFVAPLFNGDRARRYLERLSPAQDALGDANDESSALEAYRAATETDPRAWFAVGWLSARQPDTTHASQKTLRKLDKAPKFWKGSGRKKRKDR